MKLNSEPVKNWFGFTRRERRSTSILLAIIIIIIGLRYVLPEKNVEIENRGTILADSEIINVISDTDIPSGKFRKSVDFHKVYRVHRTKPDSLGSFAELSPERFGKAKADSMDQEKLLLDINSCDSLSLVDLPGIGPVLSARIIKYRNLLGGYASVEQLKEVYGLPVETYEMIKGRLFTDISKLRIIDINSAGYSDLSRIPYVEKYEVTAIMKYRELTGRIRSIEDLKENKILTPEKAGKVEPYLDFR
jgi:competence protein ComEA